VEQDYILAQLRHTGPLKRQNAFRRIPWGSTGQAWNDFRYFSRLTASFLSRHAPVKYWQGPFNGI